MLGNFSFIWISHRSFSRCSIGIDATFWRVRMISIKRVYPNRRGVGSGAIRVDGTSEYKISGRYDASETAIRDDHRGWRRVNGRAMSWERIWIFPFGVWMSFVTIAAATWGYSSLPPRGCCRCFLRTSLCNVSATLPCAIKCRLCGQVFVNVGRLTWNWPPFKSRKRGCVPLDCVSRTNNDFNSLSQEKSGERWHNFQRKYILFFFRIFLFSKVNLDIIVFKSLLRKNIF